MKIDKEFVERQACRYNVMKESINNREPQHKNFIEFQLIQHVDMML